MATDAEGEYIRPAAQYSKFLRLTKRQQKRQHDHHAYVCARADLPIVRDSARFRKMRISQQIGPDVPDSPVLGWFMCPKCSRSPSPGGSLGLRRTVSNPGFRNESRTGPCRTWWRHEGETGSQTWRFGFGYGVAPNQVTGTIAGLVVPRRPMKDQ